MRIKLNERRMKREKDGKKIEEKEKQKEKNDTETEREILTDRFTCWTNDK